MRRRRGIGTSIISSASIAAALLVCLSCPGRAAPGAPILLARRVGGAELSENLAKAFEATGQRAHAFEAVGVWSVDQGVAVDNTIAPVGPLSAQALRRLPSVEDATISADLRLGAGDQAPSAAGLLFRMTGMADGLALRLERSGSVSFCELRNGAIRLLARQALEISEHRWYHVAAVMKGRRISFLLDGRQVLEADAPGPAASGGLGFFSERGRGNAFRNLAVDNGHGSAILELDLPLIPALIAPLTNGLAQETTRSPSPEDVLIKRVMLHEDARSAIIVPPDTEIAFPVELARDTSLYYDVATLPWSGEPLANGARLEIAFDEPDRPEILLAIHHCSQGVENQSWSPARIDLGRLRPTRGRLKLRNQSIGKGPGAYIAVANPMILSGGRPPKTEHPNLILVIVDTLRADHLGTYNPHRRTSPFLDMLASRSTVFEEVIAQSTWTKSSVPSMLTSTYPETNGVRGIEDRLAEKSLTLAEVLEKRGYYTVAVQTNPWLREESGVGQGFMEYHAAPWTGGAPIVNQVATQALERRPGAPFFIYLHYMDVHDPYTPMEAYRIFGANPEDLYDGEIKQLDEQLEGLLESFRRMGLMETSVLMIASDHGEEFGEHGGRFHGGTLYSEQVRVPWIVSWENNVPPGARIRSMVRNLDIAPTALDLMGHPIPPSFQGVSLKATIESEGRTRGEELAAFSQVGLNDVAPEKDLLSLTTSRWTYMVDRRSSWRRLYDLSADPAETRDLCEKEPVLTRAFSRMLSTFLSAYGPTAATGKIKLDEETEKLLHSLGYLR